jgi:hypothetical protein
VEERVRGLKRKGFMSYRPFLIFLEDERLVLVIAIAIVESVPDEAV